MQRGATLLGLRAMKQLLVSITLQANVAPAPRDLQIKVAAYKVAKGGFKVPPLHLEVSRDPVHLKCVCCHMDYENQSGNSSIRRLRME